MEEVDCGIDDKGCQLSYDRSSKELSTCKEKDFSFDIQPPVDGKSVAVFEARKGGEVIRRNTSKMFPAGALSKKSTSLNKANFNVVLKKHEELDLNDYF